MHGCTRECRSFIRVGSRWSEQSGEVHMDAPESVIVRVGEQSRSEQSCEVCMDAPDSVDVLFLEQEVRAEWRSGNGCTCCDIAV